MTTAVSGLRDEGIYKGKVRFVLTEVTSDAVVAEIKGWEGLGSHGLIGTDDGVLKVKIPGHKFGRAEIVAKTDELLKLAAQ